MSYRIPSLRSRCRLLETDRDYPRPRFSDLLEKVSALRERPGGDVYVYGNLTLVQALLAARLVDELILMFEPITLGEGKALFPSDGQARKFELISATTANMRVQFYLYQPILS